MRLLQCSGWLAQKRNCVETNVNKVLSLRRLPLPDASLGRQRSSDALAPTHDAPLFSWASMRGSMGPDPSGALTDFIEGLGPGQLVGRQVLGAPSLGDIQLSMCYQKGYLEVEVIRARGLQAKPGSKTLPGKSKAGLKANLQLSASDIYSLPLFQHRM